ncbi:methionyl-tRNA formyltransferase [Thiobacter aerophilum]|uniref:Methionyl-tRNA formyltransferase n=1 Tax=Thiobacter aerophilum TaxID=3121275 RepID=A0ABV0EGK7_9BURK
MQLVFAGTPEFAAAALKSLTAAGHDILLVLTQPDRPAGRGLKPKPSPVKDFALKQGLPVAQPASLKDAAVQATLRKIQPQVMVVAAYGLILPPAVLSIPARGCLNIHASLLPRWRGAAPIQRALLAGDVETGITIMRMDAGLDTGPMLLQKKCPIAPEDTAGSLHDRLAALGAAAIVEALDRLDSLTPVAQDERLATYAAKLTKEEALIDWTQPAEAIARAVRAYNPFPVAYTWLDGERLRIWFARAEPGQAPAGEVVAVDRQGVRVGTGAGLLVITELQREGAKRLNAAAFAASGVLRPGMRLKPAPA